MDINVSLIRFVAGKPYPLMWLHWHDFAYWAVQNVYLYCHALVLLVCWCLY